MNLNRLMCVAALAAAACNGTKAFHCTSNAACGSGGECIEGYCAFPASTCPSGFEWDTSAGSHAGQCVPPSSDMGTGIPADMGAGVGPDMGAGVGTTDMAGTDQGAGHVADMAQAPDMAFDVSTLKWTPRTDGNANNIYGAVDGKSSNDVWIVGIVHTGSTATATDIRYTNGVVLKGPVVAPVLWVDETGIPRVPGATFGTISQIANDGSYGALEQTPTQYPIADIRGLSSTDAWAVATDGTVLHRGSDAQWTTKSQIPSGSPSAVWPITATDVYVLGSFVGVTDGGVSFETPQMWHSNDGTTFTLVVGLPQGDFVSYASVWGSASNDVYVATGSKYILHFDGAAWAAQDTGCGSQCSFVKVWGQSAGDIWAVGQNSAGSPVAHSRGDGTWQSIGVGTTNTMYGVWASGPKDVWIVGENGTILHGTP